MECPQCGNEIPDSADFCSLCFAKLAGNNAGPTSPMPASPETAGPAPEGYKSPSEWRGELVQTEIPAEEVVERRVRNVWIRNFVFATFVLAIIVGFVLMITVWGNPSPQKVLNSYLTAVTAGNETEAMSFMLPGHDLMNAQTVNAAIAAVSGMKLADLKMKLERTDQDTAKITLVGGWITPSGQTARIEITESDNFTFKLSMLKGRWYMDPLNDMPLSSV